MRGDQIVQRAWRLVVGRVRLERGAGDAGHRCAERRCLLSVEAKIWPLPKSTPGCTTMPITRDSASAKSPSQERCAMQLVGSKHGVGLR